MGIVCYYSKADGYTSCSCPLLSTVLTKADRISLPAFGGSLKDKKKAGPTPGEILAPWMGVYSIQDSVLSLKNRSLEERGVKRELPVKRRLKDCDTEEPEKKKRRT